MTKSTRVSHTNPSPETPENHSESQRGVLSRLNVFRPIPASDAQAIVFWLSFLLGMICLGFVFTSKLSWKDRFDIAAGVAALYLPVLTSFILVWYKDADATSQRFSPQPVTVPPTKFLPILALIMSPQIFIATASYSILHRTPIPFPGETPQFADLVSESMSALTKFSAVFSPLASAPTAYLLSDYRRRSQS
jgi:hypothetical protein